MALTLAPAVHAVLRLEVAGRVVVIATWVVALLTVGRMAGQEGELTAALARLPVGLQEVVRTLLNLDWKDQTFTVILHIRFIAIHELKDERNIKCKKMEPPVKFPALHFFFCLLLLNIQMADTQVTKNRKTVTITTMHKMNHDS